MRSCKYSELILLTGVLLLVFRGADRRQVWLGMWPNWLDKLI